MAKTLTISVPQKDYEMFRYAWEELATEVLTSNEAGQRGTTRSIMFQMICTAGITNFDETVRLLKEIKSLTKRTQP